MAGRNHRSGLTLLETLLTLVLTGFLLSGISMGIRQFWRYRRMAQENVSAADLRRGIAEDLAMDIRSVRQPLKQRNAPDSINKTALPLTTGDEDGIRERVLDLSESRLNLERAVGNHPVSLAGERTWLAVLLRGGSFRFPDVEPAASDLMHVVWWDGRMIRPALSLNGNRAVPLSLGNDTVLPGVYRASLPFRIHGSPSQPSDAAIHSVSTSLQRMSFRYFSGDGWVSRWNSEDQQRLPEAIECEVSGSGGSESFVIRLPAAGT
jgi:hypothetical protein